MQQWAPPPRPILVIGGTARTAAQILRQGLAQGRAVSALARHPDSIAVKDARLRGVQGNVYELASVAAAMTGPEAVISLIGSRSDPQKEAGFIDIYSVGITAIIAAMRQKGNRRLIAVSSGGTEQIPPAQPTQGSRVDEFVWRQRNLYGDMQRMEKIIALSGLEWTVLRPRGFRHGPRRDNLQLVVHEHATNFEQYQSEALRTPNPSSRLTYIDFAALVLNLIDGDRYLGTSVGVYTDIFD